MGIKGGFYHYDTPCTIDNQIKMLNTAGFKRVEKLWQQAATVLLVAQNKIIILPVFRLNHYIYFDYNGLIFEK